MKRIEVRIISKGLASGKLVTAEKRTVPVPGLTAGRDIEKELLLAEKAKDELAQKMRLQIEEAAEEIELSAILEGHLMMLEDPEYYDRICEIIKESNSATFAAYTAAKETAEVLASLDDAYMRERAEDMMDIAWRLIAAIDAEEERESTETLEAGDNHQAKSERKEGKIEAEADDAAIKSKGSKDEDNLRDINSLGLDSLGDFLYCADNIFPSDFIRFAKKPLKGFVAKACGETSHVALMAKNSSIPVVSDFEDDEYLASHKGSLMLLYALPDDVIRADILDDEELLSKFSEEFLRDIASPCVILDPDEDYLRMFKLLKDVYAKKRAELEQYRFAQIKTSDGYDVNVYANIASAEEAELAFASGADGIGLFRTEFLYMNRSNPPGEEEQFEAYVKVLRVAGGKPVTIRTMDIGGDKKVDYLGIDEEENPFLGFRAIRYCLRNPEFFMTQLRAIYRAAKEVEGSKAKIMFPMISKLSEVEEARKYAEMAREEVDGPQLELGIMAETPSVAVLITQFARHSDFISVGTNDLIQYTMAVDRGNRNIAYLYDQHDPAVLTLLHGIIKAAFVEGISVSVCGNSASDTGMTELLLAMGLRTFSVAIGDIAAVKAGITKYPAFNKLLLAEYLG